MPLLQDRLTTAVGVHPAAVLRGLGGAVVAVDLGDVRLDPGPVLALVAAAAPPDLSGVRRAAQTAQTVLASRTSGRLAAAGLPAELQGLLDLLSGLGDPGPLLDLPEVAGIDALLPQFGALTGAVDGGPLPALLRLLPGADLSGAVDRVGGALGGLVELVRVLTGLVGTAATTSRLVLGADVLAARLDVDVARGAGRLLAERSADTGLVAAVRSADPADPGTVDALAPRLLAFLQSVVDVGDVWSAGMGTGEAALLGLDLPGRALALELARLALDGADLRAVATLAADVRALAAPLLDVPLPDPASAAGDVVQSALGLASELTSTLRAWQPASLVAPVSGVLGAALGPLRDLRQAVEAAAGTVASAVQVLRDLVEEVDLDAVAVAVRTALQPVVDTLDAVEEAVGAAEDVITQVCAGLEEGLEQVAGTVEAAAAQVGDALRAALGVLRELPLRDLAEDLRDELAAVSATLAAAQLSPYFDAAVDVVRAGSDAIEAVPFAMLPTDVQQEVVDLSRPVKTLDLEPVEAALRVTLADVRRALDEDALREVRDAFDDVLTVLRGLDPLPPLQALEAGPFAELRTLVADADPAALLAPVEEALDAFRDLLAGVDLEREVLVPLEDLFAPVEAALAQADPAPLLAPLEQAVADARRRVLDLLHLDAAEAAVTTLRDRVAATLARLDVAAVVRALDAEAAARIAGLPPGPSGGALTTLLVPLAQTAGLDADDRAVADVLRWVRAAGGAGAGEVDGPTDVRDRLRHVADAVTGVQADVARLDPAPLAAAAQAQHRALTAALAAHPPDSPLRLRVDVSFAGVVPSQVLGGLAGNRRRYAAALTTAAELAGTLAASGRSEVGAAAAGLSAALVPLHAFPARARDLLALMGVVDDEAPLPEIVGALWRVAGPARVLPALADLLGVAREKVLAALDALLAPVLQSLAELRAAVDAVDVGGVVRDVVALHARVLVEVTALSPEALLRPALSEAQEVLDRLAAFDPLGPVRGVVDAARATADRVLEAARPTGLFEPAVQVHAELLGLATGLDVEVLLRPVLDALSGLGLQLDDGFSRTVDALQRLQAALPDAVQPASSSVSASASVSLGG